MNNLMNKRTTPKDSLLRKEGYKKNPKMKS
ncbi:hypothetical protein EZS27_014585 [termite gut metagenome]|uniref:Uncharacterized protein n=1 Tax=termite gut metagenome TaxID=433724 RepID=A0A5J4RTM6_9ZZZZ